MMERKGEEVYLKTLMEEVKVKDAMNTSLVTIYEDQEFSEAFLKFKEFRLTHLAVLSRKDKYVGIISQKYIYKAQSPRKMIGAEDMQYSPNIIIDGDTFYDKDVLDSYILRKIMYKNAFSLQEDESLGKAIRAMYDKRIDFIPILDKDQQLRGTLTNLDVIGYIARLIK